MTFFENTNFESVRATFTLSRTLMPSRPKTVGEMRAAFSSVCDLPAGCLAYVYGGANGCLTLQGDFLSVRVFIFSNMPPGEGEMLAHIPREGSSRVGERKEENSPGDQSTSTPFGGVLGRKLHNLLWRQGEGVNGWFEECQHICSLNRSIVVDVM